MTWLGWLCLISRYSSVCPQRKADASQPILAELSLRGCLYVIQKIGSRKAYVGITVREPEKRWIEHSKAAAAGSQQLLHKALALYGMQNFRFEVIWRGLANELFAREMAAIAALKTLAPNGYNMTMGGERFPLRIPQSRALMRLGVDRIDDVELVLKTVRSANHPAKKDVCKLSLDEATKLIDYGVWPQCRKHHHTSKLQACTASFKPLLYADGEFTGMVLPVTELGGWVRWDWDNDFMKNEAYGGVLSSIS